MSNILYEFCQLMILVDDAGGVYERIDHSPWNGCTLADFVMPFFLFIVGVAIALALKVPLYIYETCFQPSVILSFNKLYLSQRVPNTKYAVRKIIIRTLKMLFWGILLQGNHHGLKVAVLVIYMKYFCH